MADTVTVRIYDSDSATDDLKKFTVNKSIKISELQDTYGKASHYDIKQGVWRYHHHYIQYYAIIVHRPKGKVLDYIKRTNHDDTINDITLDLMNGDIIKIMLTKKF